MTNSKFQTPNLKIALAHDSFTQLGGAERVINALHELFPEAPVFTTVFDGKFSDSYKSWDIRTSWLQVIYNFYPRFKHLLPFIPMAVSSLDLRGYDLVISSSSGFAKNIKVSKDCVHINYCHTPARFLWSDSDYVEQETPPMLRPAVKLFLKWMRKWDYRGAQRVSYFIANSREVQSRIEKYYSRNSEVIHPFINDFFWKPTLAKQDYFLLGGRLQPHKKNELIVEVFNELGLPLRVFGTGRQEKYLKSIAKDNITFLGRITDEELRDEYSGALGFIYPQLEDFGLMPLEAAACGTSTLAYGQGGALETVIPGVTGQLFDRYNRELIKESIQNWRTEMYDQASLIRHAKTFGTEVFKEKIRAAVARMLSQSGL